MKDTNTQTLPEWAIRTERALPKINRPRLSEIAPDLLAPERVRPLAVFLIARPLFLFVVFIAAAVAGWWPVAILASFALYGATITAVHHLIHSSLGLSPTFRQFWLTVLGCLVLESGHALQVTHLAHHRSDPSVPDPEGYIENVTWLQLPLAALRFRYRLALWGLRYGPRKAAVRNEILFHAAVHLLSLALLPINPILWIYLTSIHFSSFAFAVLAGKGPQTNWGRKITSPFVRVHTRLGAILFFSHDLHLEHHAYPKVPLPMLRDLSDELSATFESLPVQEVRMPV